VGNVQLGKMNHWVRFYEEVMEFKLFKHFDDNDISTEFSALMSKVMSSGSGLIKIPINEPAAGKKKSQIEEYLDWHQGTAGVQHLALRTDDELHSIAELRRRGVEFLTIPDAYYDKVWERVDTMLKTNGHAGVKEDHQKIRDLGILVDADDEGYLLQLFTRPLQDRPTLFFEIICRRGSQSFGKGNFKALFESLEIEQSRRVGERSRPAPSFMPLALAAAISFLCELSPCQNLVFSRLSPFRWGTPTRLLTRSPMQCSMPCLRTILAAAWRVRRSAAPAWWSLLAK
jgi:4-hydroxyphenylpyruvate dioxygenase